MPAGPYDPDHDLPNWDAFRFSMDHANAQLTLAGLRDQARDMLSFPPLAVNVLSDGDLMTVVIEFHRTPGSALDATVVELTYEQVQLLMEFFTATLGTGTEQAAIARLNIPTKEEPDDEPVPPEA